MRNVVCPGCGISSAIARPLPSYHYRESGLANVWLRGGVTETKCTECRQRHYRIENETQLLQVIACGLLVDARPLTGHEMRFLRGACNMSQAQLAEILKRRRETIAEREAKSSIPGISFADEVVLRWVLLTRFRRHLSGDGNDFLPRRHHALLSGFSDFFDDFSRKYVDEAFKRSRMVAALHGESWSLEKKAA